jgi:hypothetical protein
LFLDALPLCLVVPSLPPTVWGAGHLSGDQDGVTWPIVPKIPVRVTGHFRINIFAILYIFFQGLQT